jgi:hypothetical protein
MGFIMLAIWALGSFSSVAVDSAADDDDVVAVVVVAAADGSSVLSSVSKAKSVVVIRIHVFPTTEGEEAAATAGASPPTVYRLVVGDVGANANTATTGRYSAMTRMATKNVRDNMVSEFCLGVYLWNYKTGERMQGNALLTVYCIV